MSANCWRPSGKRASSRANEEAGDIADLIAAEGHNHQPAKWDWRHYAEKIRQQRFDFSDDDVKPYMRLEKMIEAAFAVATKLFGVTFEEIEACRSITRMRGYGR
jgi:peptidyl-dipeptidase Dcp